MIWDKETMEALHNWLAPDTSYKDHPAEDDRFYLFIGYVWRKYHGLWDEQIAREIITHKAKELHQWEPDLLNEVVEKRMSEGTLILGFLSAIKNEHKLNELIR